MVVVVAGFGFMRAMLRVVHRRMVMGVSMAVSVAEGNRMMARPMVMPDPADQHISAHRDRRSKEHGQDGREDVPKRCHSPHVSPSEAATIANTQN